MTEPGRVSSCFRWGCDHEATEALHAPLTGKDGAACADHVQQALDIGWERASGRVSSLNGHDFGPYHYAGMGNTERECLTCHFRQDEQLEDERVPPCTSGRVLTVDDDWDAQHVFTDVASPTSTAPVCLCGRSRWNPVHTKTAPARTPSTQKD